MLSCEACLGYWESRLIELVALIRSWISKHPYILRRQQFVGGSRVLAVTKKAGLDRCLPKFELLSTVIDQLFYVKRKWLTVPLQFVLIQAAMPFFLFYFFFSELGYSYLPIANNDTGVVNLKLCSFWWLNQIMARAHRRTLNVYKEGFKAFLKHPAQTFRTNYIFSTRCTPSHMCM